VDVISCRSALEYTQQADFSINSLLYDPIIKEVIGSDDALTDLHQKILRPLYQSYFITSPKAFTRAFRQSAQFGLNLAPEIKMLAEHYGHIQLMATPDQAPKVFSEFIHFLSMSNVSLLLSQFISWGLLNGILPEATSHRCINPHTHRTFLEDHIAWIDALDKLVEQLPASEKMALTEWRFKKFSMNPKEPNRFSTVKYTQLGLFRLACLLSDLGTSVYSLDDLKEDVSPSKIRSASESLINNLALRQQLHHIVYSLILNAGELALQVEDEYAREKESPTLLSRNDLCTKAPSRHKEDAIWLLALVKQEAFG
jgi:tRNA nucleotidyltransferase/poly(A) polymerase